MAAEDLSGGIDIQQHVQQKQLANLEVRVGAMGAGQAIFDKLVLAYLDEFGTGAMVNPDRLREIANFAQRIGFYRLQAAGLVQVDEQRHWGPGDAGRKRP